MNTTNLTDCSNCGQQNPVNSRFCSRCGMALSETTTSDISSGTRLRDRYIIRSLLGQGGFGKTYLAEDTGRFNTWIVLKELTPSDRGTYALQKAEELFQREAEMLHKLDHPQIPRFWEFFRDEKRLFLVQDYVEGQTYHDLLSQRLKQGQCFSETEITQLLQQLLPVLNYLHSQGIIHRDISPDNIMCRAKDQLPILIDLGGVKQIVAEVNRGQDGTPSAATRLGKMGFAPEEQMRLGIAAPHSDLYALAVTCLVLLTGRQPGDLMDVQTLEWRSDRYVRLSPSLTAILNRMLAPQPVDRFQSANEILRLLDTNRTVVEIQQENRFDRVYEHDTQPRENRFDPVYNPTPQPSINTRIATVPGQGYVYDNSVKVPEEIRGWNWGAFFLPGFWCLTNRVWVGLISWADLSVITLPVTLGSTWFVMSIVLGIKGNEWAWKSRHWDSVKDFKRHQRIWAIAGLIINLAILALIILILVLILLGLSMGSMGGMGGGD